MKELNKLFDDIELQLNDESIKYRRLKICKYSFEVSKVIILLLSVGLSFMSIFSILSVIFIPIKHSSDVDSRLFQTKLKKDLLKELKNYKSSTYKN